MTDSGWVAGMAVLQSAGLPGWPAEGTRESTLRSRVYRDHLDDLSDEVFLFAAGEAIKLCTFFPKVAELRAFAENYKPGPRVDKSHQLAPSSLSPEELEAAREARRANAREGLRILREAFAARELPVPSEPVREMPKPLPEDEEADRRRDERLRVLKAQAKQIAGDTPAGGA